MSNGWKYLRMDSAIEKAKRRVENAYGCVQGSRKWLETLPLDSYEDESYRVKLFVLEGSPCKGYVLGASKANPRHFNGGIQPSTTT